MSAITYGTPVRPLQRPRGWRFINTVITVTARDVVLAVKSPSTLIVSLVMPLLMMGLIGGNLRTT